MDAVEFLKTKNRICKTHSDCCLCELKSKTKGCSVGFKPNQSAKEAERIVSIVEKWASEHPVKTRQSEFLKMFPNAEIKKGVVNIYPCSIDTVEVQGSGEYCQSINGDCDKCREAYWLAEVE